MRLTKDLLLRLTKTHVAERLLEKPRPLCIYLTGSLCTEDFLLGGTTDIDLVFIHNLKPETERQLVAVTPDIHLDIWHYDVTVFEQPRQLRRNVWIGSFLCENPLVLHDNGHWFEYTQASACAQFFRPENSLLRAQPLLDAARQRWMECFSGTHKPGVFTLRAYLRSIEDACNAFACLTGLPFAERRLITQFANRAKAEGRSSLTGLLVDMMTSPAVNEENWKSWQQNWQAALKESAGLPNCPVHLSALRQPYYLQAAQAQWESFPASAVWNMLKTWTDAVISLPPDSLQLKQWEVMCAELELSPENYAPRLEKLDQFLDEIEVFVDQFKIRNSLIKS